MCSLNTLASMCGGFIDTAESRQFIASCRLLAHHAGLHSHRMLCWFLIPKSIGCGLHSLLYLPPSSVSENFYVAAAEEYERGEYSLRELELDRCIGTLARTDGPHQAYSVAAAVRRFLNRDIERSSSDMSRALSLHPGPCPGEHTCEHVQAMGRALQAMTRVGQTTFRVRRVVSCRQLNRLP